MCRYDRKEELLKKIDWTQRRQVAFFGLLLTSLLGIVGIAPSLPKVEKWLGSPMVIMFYVILMIAIVGSIYQISSYMLFIANKQEELTNHFGWHFHRRNWNKLMRWLIIPTKDDEEPYKKNKIVLYTYYIIALLPCVLLLFEKLEINFVRACILYTQMGEPKLMALDLSQILAVISTASAAASAICAYLIYKGNKVSRQAMEEWSKTLVQPRIFIRPSTRAARERMRIGPGGLTEEQIEIPGVFVENIGMGPAVKGIIYVVDHQNNRIPIRSTGSDYSFLRIPAGNVYHYPSHDVPELEQFVRGQTTIRLQIEYFDIKDNLYSLPEAEERIDLRLD